MLIRRFKKTDAREVSSLVSQSFNEFIASDCTKEGIKKFLEKQTPEQQVERAETMDVFVAVIDDKIAGMVEADKNKCKVTMLFVSKKYHRKGIARALMNKIEKLYKEKGVVNIKIYSSLYAQKFYEKIGYKKSRGLVKRGGIVHQPMKKVLK